MESLRIVCCQNISLGNKEGDDENSREDMHLTFIDFRIIIRSESPFLRGQHGTAD
jgi:hypothetical protein